MKKLRAAVRRMMEDRIQRGHRNWLLYACTLDQRDGYPIIPLRTFLENHAPEQREAA